MKKCSLVILFIVICSIYSQAQLAISTIKSISACRNKWGIIDTVSIPLMVTGNIGSFTAKWDFKYYVGFNLYIYGSMIINDTASTHPNLVSADALPNNIWMPLYVTVTDSIGNIARDSIQLRYSWFTCLADFTERTISLFDTIGIYPVSITAIPPLHYTWSPNYAISDTTRRSPKVFPDRNTIYTCTVTDSLGCVSDWGDVWTIYVDSTRTDLDNLQHGLSPEFSITPNPLLSEAFVSLCASRRGVVRFYNVSGQLLNEVSFEKGTSKISGSVFKDMRGNIFYRAVYDDLTVRSGNLRVLR